MNHYEHEFYEEHGNFVIVDSPVGGYWVCTTTVTGELILKESTRTLDTARQVCILLLSIVISLQEEIENDLDNSDH